VRKSKRVVIGKIDYWASCGEAAGNLIRDYTVNQEMFFTVGALTQNYLPNDINPPTAKPYAISRLNQTFARKNYLQGLRDITVG
jgi:hypothetical protein